MTADDNHHMLNGDILVQGIQIQLSQKQKTFPKFFFFFAFLKYILNFKHLQKKMTLIADVFPEIRTQKIWLHKCLRGRV